MTPIARCLRGLVWLLLLNPAETAVAGSAGAERCASCHSTEYAEWSGSRHAGAFSAAFRLLWEQHGNSPDCLRCHTTGADTRQGTFAFPGVSCESCHGPFTPAHPGAAKMVLPTDSSACMDCHAHTYREWQLSGHAKHNIRCFDCHAVHRQGLRQPEAEQQCGACHAQRLEDFAHATHHVQGLTCTTCHMPAPRTSGIGGTGAPAHSFFVGAETCAACHEEMVHSSHKISSLSEEVDRLTQTANVRQVERMQAQIRELESAVDAQKSRAVKISLGTLVAGLVLGVASSVLARRKNGSSTPRGL